MLANLNFTIVIAVIIAGIIGLIALSVSGGKIKHDSSLDIMNEDNERCLNDASVAGGDGSTLPKTD